MRRALAAAAVLAFAPSLAAQHDDPVRVVTCLSVDAAAAVRKHLETALPDEACRVEILDTLEVTGRWADAIGDVDVACGVDTQLVAMAADREDLAVRGHAGLRQFWLDDQHRFVTPWARGWVFVWRLGGPVESVEGLAALARPDLDGRIALPSPRAAPSLWANWLRQWTALGEGEDTVFTWLASIDARIGHYEPTPGAVAAALESGGRTLGVLPAGDAIALRERLGDDRIAFGVTRQGMSIEGMSLAVVAASPRLVRAERVFDALLDPELTRTLRDEHRVLTPDLGDGGLADGAGRRHDLGTLADGAFPFAPIRTETALSVYDRWEEYVRGRGSSLERFELVFDLVLAVLFVCVAWWIFRNVGREAPTGPGTESEDAAGS